LKHTVAVVTHADVIQNFYTTWVQGVACQKQCLRPKLDGDWARGAFKIFGTPYVFMKPLKLATSNLVHNLVLGLAYQKNNQNCWGSGPGEHPKIIWDPLRIFATVEASNFKLGTQIGFGTSLPKNDV